jgi:phage-related protein
MGLTEVGVRLEAQAADAFQSAMQAAKQATLAFGKASEQAAILSKQLDKNMNSTADSASELARKNVELAASQRLVQSEVKKTDTNFGNLFKTIGGKALELPGIKSIAEDSKNAAALIGTFTNKLADMKTGLFAVGGVITGVGAGFTALGGALHLAGAAATAAQAGFVGLGIIGLAKDEAKKFTEAIKEQQKELANAKVGVNATAAEYAKMQANLKSLEEQQSRTFLGMIQGVGKFFNESAKFVATPLFEPLKAQLASLLNYLNSPVVTQWLVTLQTKVAAFAQNDLPKLVSAFTSFARGVADAMPTIMAFKQAIEGIGGAAITPITQGLSLFGEGLAKINIHSAASTGAIQTLTNIAGAFGKTITVIGTVVGNLVQGLAIGLTPAVKSISQGLNDAFGNANGFKDILEKIGAGAQKFGELLGGTLGAAAQFAAKLIEIGSNSGFFSDKLSILETIMTTIKDVFNIFTNALTQNQPIIEQAVGTISTLLSNAFTFIGNIVTQVAQFIADHMDEIARVLNNVGQIATDVFNLLASTIQNNMPLFEGIWNTLFSIADVVSSILVPAIKVLTEWWGFLTSAITFLVTTALQPVIFAINLVIKGINLLIAGYNLLAPAIGQKTIPAIQELNLNMDTSTKKTNDASTATKGLSGNLLSLGQTGKDVATTFTTDITKLGSGTQAEVTKIISAIQSGNPQIVAEGKKAGLALINSYNENATKLSPETEKIMRQLGNTIDASARNEVAPKAATGGQNIGQSLMSGISGKIQALVPQIIAEAANAIAAIVAAMKQKAQIHSPSQVTAKEIGEPLVMGIVKGMLDSSKVAARTASDVVNETFDAATRTADKRSTELAAIIRNIPSGISGHNNAIGTGGNYGSGAGIGISGATMGAPASVGNVAPPLSAGFGGVSSLVPELPKGALGGGVVIPQNNQNTTNNTNTSVSNHYTLSMSSMRSTGGIIADFNQMAIMSR